MSKILFLLFSLYNLVYSDTIFCQRCLNEECDANVSTATTCDFQSVNSSYHVLNNAYRQNYTAPSSISSYDCIYINTTFELTNNETENFIYKGCVENGFQIKNVEPNEKYIVKEDRSIFEVCDSNFCTNFPPTPPPKLFSCYVCEDEESCKEENLKQQTCDSNVARTYNLLSKHYKIYYPPTGSTDYECLSINSTLSGEYYSRLVMKGCIQKGFNACDLGFSRNWYNKEVKEFCKICTGDLCNENKVSKKLPTIFFFFGFGILKP